MMSAIKILNQIIFTYILIIDEEIIKDGFNKGFFGPVFIYN